MWVKHFAATTVILTAALLGVLGTTWATAQVPETLAEFGANRSTLHMRVGTATQMVVFRC